MGVRSEQSPHDRHSLMSLDAHDVGPWTRAEVRHVLDAYGLGETAGETALAAEPRWDKSRAWCRVRTVNAVGGVAEWFLKKHHPAVCCREQHAVVEAFRALGGRAPEVVARPDGATWHELGDAVAEVQEVMAGRAMTRPTNALARDAVAQLAIWQRVPGGLIPEYRTGWHTTHVAGDLIQRAAERLDAEILLDGEARLMLDEEAAFDPDEPVGRWGPVHGDLWMANWMADGEDISALTDFDWVHYGSLVDDLADVLLAFCTNRDAPLDRPSLVEPPGVSTSRFELMVRRYEELSGPMSEDERRALPDRLRSHWVRHMAWTLIGLRERVHLRIVVTRAVEFDRWRRTRLPDLLREMPTGN